MGPVDSLCSGPVQLFRYFIHTNTLPNRNFFQAGLLLSLRLWTPSQEDPALYHVIAGVWGFCVGVWQTLTTGMKRGDAKVSKPAKKLTFRSSFTMTIVGLHFCELKNTQNLAYIGSYTEGCHGQKLTQHPVRYIEKNIFPLIKPRASAKLFITHSHIAFLRRQGV